MIEQAELWDEGIRPPPWDPRIAGIEAADGRHYWLTPPKLYADLDAEFHFDFDPCPYPRPDDFDGTKVEWGQSNYVNPPFTGPTKWVRKAIEENKKGKRVVFVFPIDKWVHLMLQAGATVRNLGDVRWCAIEDGQPGKGTGRHIAAFILEPKPFEAVKEDAVSRQAGAYGADCWWQMASMGRKESMRTPKAVP